MNKLYKTQLWDRKRVFWALIVILTLVLVPGAGRNVGAWERGSGGAEGQGSAEAELRTGAREQSAIHNPQSAIASRTISYTYDAAGRLVAVDYGGGKTIHYTYDNAGNLRQRCTLTADYNSDADVNIAEIVQVARRWGAGTGDPLYDAAYDLDGDGVIDVADVMGAAGQWRLC